MLDLRRVNIDSSTAPFAKEGPNMSEDPTAQLLCQKAAPLKRGIVEHRDFIVTATALPSKEGKPTPRMTKRWFLGADGKPECQDYDKGFLYSFERRPVNSLVDIEAVLASLTPHQCVVPGDIAEGIDASCARRVKKLQKDGTPPSLVDCGHLWQMFDVENLIPQDEQGAYDPVAEPARAVTQITQQMRPEYRQASFLWQLTSSAGFKKSGEIRMRLTCWNSRRLTLAEQKVLVAEHRIKGPKGARTGFIDDSIYSAEHPIYGAPVIDPRLTDPVPVRMDIEERDQPVVVVSEEIATKVEGVAKAKGSRPRRRLSENADRIARGDLLTGEPISLKILADMLGCLDPGCNRDEWRDIIAAIRAAPVPGDEDESGRRQLAHEWSLPAHNYVGPDDVDRVFDDMLPPEPGADHKVHVGSLIAKARAAGYAGPNSIAEAERYARFFAAAEEYAGSGFMQRLIEASQGAISVMPELPAREPSPAFAERARRQVAVVSRRVV